MTEYNSTISMDELFMNPTACMNLKIIVLIERQTRVHTV